MAKQTKRLIGPLQLGVTGTSDDSKCTPATSTAVVLRHIKATNCDTSSTHYLCISIGANTAATRIVDQIAIAPNSEYERWGLFYVGPAEFVCASADTASKISLTVNGDFITLG